MTNELLEAIRLQSYTIKNYQSLVVLASIASGVISYIISSYFFKTKIQNADRKMREVHKLASHANAIVDAKKKEMEAINEKQAQSEAASRTPKIHMSNKLR